MVTEVLKSVYLYIVGVYFTGNLALKKYQNLSYLFLMCESGLGVY